MKKLLKKLVHLSVFIYFSFVFGWTILLFISVPIIFGYLFFHFFRSDLFELIRKKAESLNTTIDEKIHTLYKKLKI